MRWSDEKLLEGCNDNYSDRCVYELNILHPKTNSTGIMDS